MQPEMKEKVAKVLDASAKYTKALETQNASLKEKVAEYQAKEKQADVQPVIDKVEAVIGEPINQEMKDKIAADKDVLALLSRVSSEEDVTPIGEVSTEKTASESGSCRSAATTA